jgi:hypothetical protein
VSDESSEVSATCRACGSPIDPDTSEACPVCGNVGKHINAKAVSTVLLTASAIADVRYSFTALFLRGAALFARGAREIEDAAGQAADEMTKAEHRAYVVAAIMQSVAALEADVSEVLVHGPGHHLGSNGIDHVARDFLRPLVEIIDRQETLRRYELVLHLLKKPVLDRGVQPYQGADLLVKLRNELVHYKSKWGQEMERQKLFERLRQLRFESPPFIPNHGTNFFPHQLLSSSCASWAVSTTTEFISTFYSLLGFPGPLEPHKEGLSVPPIRHRK